MSIDCGDNSCMFAPRPLTGMRTNGGCRCLVKAGFDCSNMKSLLMMLPEILRLREENKKIREIMQSEALLNTSLFRENERLNKQLEKLEEEIAYNEAGETGE